MPHGAEMKPGTHLQRTLSPKKIQRKRDCEGALVNRQVHYANEPIGVRCEHMDTMR